MGEQGLASPAIGDRQNAELAIEARSKATTPAFEALGDDIGDGNAAGATMADLPSQLVKVR